MNRVCTQHGIFSIASYLGEVSLALSVCLCVRDVCMYVQAGHVIHLAAAMHSSSPTVQEHALHCIKLLSPSLSGCHEMLIISAMESLTAGVQDSNSVMGEELESCSDDDDESLMDCDLA